MTMFALALGAFILLHVGVSATPLRAALVKAIGEGPYRGAFAVASLAVFVWMIQAYGAARVDPANHRLWSPPDGLHHLTQLLAMAGVVLAMTGLLTPGPTTAGFEASLAKADAARGVLRVTRHPFLWGVALWGAGHLASNPETTSVLLFGGLTVMVLLGTRSIDHKAAARNPDQWAAFKAATSNIPFAAIVQGRNRFALGEMAPRLLVALLVFALIAYYHRLAFGVRAFDFGA